jgi:hypothetical protein
MIGVRKNHVDQFGMKVWRLQIQQKQFYQKTVIRNICAENEVYKFSTDFPKKITEEKEQMQIALE